MKKVLFTALFALSSAYAQTWVVDGPFQDEFVGCARISSGQVQCTMKSTYIGSGPTYFGATYYATDSAAYAPDNKRYIATRSSIGGKDTTTANVNVSKANPVSVVYTFDYPANFDRIALLFLDTGMLKQVPIRGAAPAAAAPSASATQAAAPAPQPAASAAASAPATAQPKSIALNNFDIKLTGCALNNQGGYTCNQAELIPRH